jgi:hypothetical protein
MYRRPRLAGRTNADETRSPALCGRAAKIQLPSATRLAVKLAVKTGPNWSFGGRFESWPRSSGDRAAVSYAWRSRPPQSDNVHCVFERDPHLCVVVRHYASSSVKIGCQIGFSGEPRQVTYSGGGWVIVSLLTPPGVGSDHPRARNQQVSPQNASGCITTAWSAHRRSRGETRALARMTPSIQTDVGRRRVRGPAG